MQGALANAHCIFTARERRPMALLGHGVLSDALNADKLKWLKNPDLGPQSRLTREKCFLVTMYFVYVDLLFLFFPHLRVQKTELNFSKLHYPINFNRKKHYML